jgi:hypothetical protein
MEVILKLDAEGDLSNDEILALNELSRTENIPPGDLAARYLREGIKRELSDLGTPPKHRVASPPSPTWLASPHGAAPTEDKVHRT